MPDWLKQVSKELHSVTKNTDDPFNYVIDSTSNYTPKITTPFWIAPNPNLENIEFGKSNNNVSIVVFKNRFYIALRTGRTHFASKHTKLFMLSTSDFNNWKTELVFATGKDYREPYLIEIADSLRFFCFEAGVKMSKFEPQRIRKFTLIDSVWSAPIEVLQKGEVHWEMKNRLETTWFSSYKGAHYELKKPSSVDLYFGKEEKNELLNKKVYFGGVSETAFEFDADSNLWAVTRLEDGDKTGFGSHVVFASKKNLNQWEFPSKADVNCYMSPRMFRHNDELYLIARKQLGKQPFGRAKTTLSWKKQRLKNWIRYSLTPKTTALYRINKELRKIEWIMDLPGTGDTAFPSIQRLDEHRFLIANYSSPLSKKKRPWLFGQLGKTGIYLVVLEFSKDKN